MKFIHIRDKIMYHDSHWKIQDRKILHTLCSYVNLFNIEFVHLFIQIILKSHFHIFNLCQSLFHGKFPTSDFPQIPHPDFLDHPQPQAHLRFPFPFLIEHKLFARIWLLVLAFLFSISFSHMINLTSEKFNNLNASHFSFSEWTFQPKYPLNAQNRMLLSCQKSPV